MGNIVGIYKITNPCGLIYIGQSKNIRRRFNCYSRLACRQQIKLYNSFKKYGFENHIIEIIEECKLEELNEREIYYINFYNSFNTKHGLNLQSGGNRPKVSEETIQKLKLNCGKHMIGKHHSLETKKKMSDARMGAKVSDKTKTKQSILRKGKYVGKDNHFYGKKHTSDTLDKMKISHTNVTDETRKRLSISQKGKKMSIESSKKKSEYMTGRFIGNKNPMFGKKGELSPNFGLKRTEETKKKLRIVRSKMTEETKEKIRKTLKQKYINKEIINPNLGISMSNEQKSKILNSREITRQERLVMIF